MILKGAALILLSERLQELGTPSHDPLRSRKKNTKLRFGIPECKKWKRINWKYRQFQWSLFNYNQKKHQQKKMKWKSLLFTVFLLFGFFVLLEDLFQFEWIHKRDLRLKKQDVLTCSLKSLMSLNSLRSLGKCLAPHLCSMGETKFCRKNEREKDEREFFSWCTAGSGSVSHSSSSAAACEIIFKTLVSERVITAKFFLGRWFLDQLFFSLCLMLVLNSCLFHFGDSSGVNALIHRHFSLLGGKSWFVKNRKRAQKCFDIPRRSFWIMSNDIALWTHTG